MYDKVSGNKLVTFSQNVSEEGKDKWEELAIGLTANQAVDIEVVCENADENNRAVFFDEISVKVQSVPTPIVVQENHYYPFGLGMRGLDWTLTPAKENKFQYNGGVEKNTDFDLNWYETDFRAYDAQIGRFNQVDALAAFFKSVTPYNFAFNNPIRYNDPHGLSPKPARNFNSTEGFWQFVSGLVADNNVVNATINNEGNGNYEVSTVSKTSWTEAGIPQEMDSFSPMIDGATLTSYNVKLSGTANNAAKSISHLRYWRDFERNRESTHEFGMAMTGLVGMVGIYALAPLLPAATKMATNHLTSVGLKGMATNAGIEIAGQMSTNLMLNNPNADNWYGIKDIDYADIGTASIGLNPVITAFLQAEFDWKPFSPSTPGFTVQTDPKYVLVNTMFGSIGGKLNNAIGEVGFGIKATIDTWSKSVPTGVLK